MQSQIATVEARYRAVEEEFRRYKIATDKSQVRSANVDLDVGPRFPLQNGQLRQELLAKQDEVKRLQQELADSRESEERARARLIDGLREIQRLKRQKEQEEQVCSSVQSCKEG